MGTSADGISVSYTVPRSAKEWELEEESVPESIVHDRAVELLKAILAAWAYRRGATEVVRNLAVRWDERRPKVGVDPDICVLSPVARDHEDLRSLRTWEPGRAAPLLAIEVVSETNAAKDYAIAPDKYAACGVRELWVFDPLLSGPTAHGGPHRLQVWDRDETGSFVRRYAGEGPVRSPLLDAYLVVVHEGRKLRIAEDREGTRFWTTAEEAERAAKEAERAAKEAERAAKEAERAAKEAERAAKEAALARIAELEAELAKRG